MKTKMNHRLYRIILAASALFFAGTPAWAVPTFIPPWGWTGPSVTTQGWEFAPGENFLLAPAYVDNPYGQPHIDWAAANPAFVPNGPTGVGIATWEVNADGGGPLISLFNDPTPNPIKYIHLQFVSDRAAVVPPFSGPPGVSVAGSVVELSNGWAAYEWIMAIAPNPPFEQLYIPFAAGTHIEQIWVSTLCTVPEPAALLMIAVGAVCTLKRRNRQTR